MCALAYACRLICPILRRAHRRPRPGISKHSPGASKRKAGI